MLPLNAVVREYINIGTLGIAILLGWWLLGWARPRSQEGKLATTLVILMALIFQVITFVLFGLKLGFVHNVYNWSFDSVFRVFLPVFLMIVLVEILRGQMILKGHESRVAIIGTILALAALEVIWVWPVYDLAQPEEVFGILMVVALPSLLKGIMLTYVAYRYDYWANVTYRLIMELPIYLLPFLPNVSNYLVVMFETALVLIITLTLVKMQGRRETRADKIERPASNGKLKWQQVLKYSGIGIAVVVMAAYVGLMSGIFKYHLLAVGSGSMEPNISRGDMVLVEKSDKYDEIEEGEVLVYRHANVVMIHRVVERSEYDGTYYFRTKGDANDSKDAWSVEQKDVIGVAKSKIIALGYPTLWLNELFNGGNV